MAHKRQQNRIPSLDGLRAVAISLVLVGHLVGTRHFPLPKWIGYLFGLGELGVQVFFVISGFLITGILLRELEAARTIHLTKFYFRRTLRIFPAYYAFLLIVSSLAMVGWLHLNPGDVRTAATYTANYDPERSWNVGHTWSLAVEEQFYLLWSALLLLAGRRKALWGAASLLILCPLIRLYLWHYYPSIRPEIGNRFETVADALAIGCVLAGIRNGLKRQRIYEKVLESRLFLLVPVCVLGVGVLNEHPRLDFVFGITLQNIGIAACLDWCITYPHSRLGRLLNAGPVAFIGVMSYSIYLWQQPFCNRYSDAITSTFPVNMICVAAVGPISYYLIEQPCLRWRQQLEFRLFRRRNQQAQDTLMQRANSAHEVTVPVYEQPGRE